MRRTFALGYVRRVEEPNERLTAHNQETLAWLTRAFIFSATEDRFALRPYLSAVADEVILEMRDGTRARVLSRDGTR